MSRLVVGTLQGLASKNGLIEVPSGSRIAQSGMVLQVVSTYYTEPQSQSIPSTFNTYTDIPGVAATITPRALGSRIYAMVRWFGEFNAQTALYNSMFALKRNGTVIGLPAQPGSLTLGITMGALSYWVADADSTPETAMFDYSDTPNTLSPVTYQLCIASNTGATLFTNRTVNATTTGGYERGSSSITLMEIAA